MGLRFTCRKPDTHRNLYFRSCTNWLNLHLRSFFTAWRWQRSSAALKSHSGLTSPLPTQHFKSWKRLPVAAVSSDFSTCTSQVMTNNECSFVANAYKYLAPNVTTRPANQKKSTIQFDSPVVSRHDTDRNEKTSDKLPKPIVIPKERAWVRVRLSPLNSSVK